MTRLSLSRSLGATVALLAVAALGRSTEKLLNIGSPAPALEVAKWLKGTPVASFEPGKVYVVEFWATWCGPCKAAMPHLSELARPYKGKATFIGVDVFERGENTGAQVQAFVKGMGDKMDYNVCADGSKGTMANTWLRAAGESGIPCTFIVDGQGKVAWIGHPMKLEDALPKVIDRTGDFRDLARTREGSKTNAAVSPDATQPIQAAIDAKDYAKTVAEIDRAASNPALARKFDPEKLRALMHIDEARGKTFAREIVEGAATHPMGQVDLLKAGAVLASSEGLSKGGYGLAVDLLTKALEFKPTAPPPPGAMRIGINAEAVKMLIEKTRAKAAS